MTRRRRDAWHADLMAGYYLAVHAQELQCEAETLGYATEMREWYESNRRLTFKRYLQEMRVNR